MFITYRFIYRIKLFFTQIGLDIEEDVAIADICEYFQNAIAKIKSVVDINDLIREFDFCYKNIKKIDKMLSEPNKKSEFDYITFKKEDLYEKFDEDNNVVITNALNDKRTQFTIYNPFFEEEEYKEITTEIKRSKISIFTDSEYYGIDSGTHFSIHSNDKKVIIDVQLKDNGDGLEFINKVKNSAFIFKNENGYTDLFDKTKSAKEEFATIASDILSEKVFDRSTQILWSFDEDYYEISLLVSIAINVLTSEHFKRQDRRNKMMMYLGYRQIN